MKTRGIAGNTEPQVKIRGQVGKDGRLIFESDGPEAEFPNARVVVQRRLITEEDTSTDWSKVKEGVETFQRKTCVQKGKIRVIRERMGVSDDNDVEGGGEAEEEGPAEGAGRVLEPVRVDKDTFVSARVGGEIVDVGELVGVSIIRVLGPDGVEKALRKAGGVRFADGKDVRLEKGRRDAGQGAALVVIETDEELHVKFFHEAAKQGFWELEGVRNLWVRRLPVEKNRVFINPEIGTAEAGRGSSGVDHPEG
jgi:hypothetical protein